MIAIKGMEEIPKNCEDCPLCSEYDGECGVVGYDPKADITKERMKDCPLVEIVLCKDCKHRIGCKCTLLNLLVDDSGFCANAERRE